MPEQLWLAIGVVVAFLVLLGLLRAFWRVAEPNEALIVSGLGARAKHHLEPNTTGFKIVTGKGVLVLPGFQVARRLSLDTRVSEISVHCVTKQGIPVSVQGVVIYKVGDDYASIAKAARRFLDQQENMDTRIHSVFAGHMRSIVGALTVEELIRDREKLITEVSRSSESEMIRLGLMVDSLQVQEIDDATGYIANLGKPHAAAVAAAARIAEAHHDQEATQAEQAAAIEKASAHREARIKQAGFQAEIDQANAQANQAGPLADATARQKVVVESTRTAELEANYAEQRLQSQVRKPADAKAYEVRVLAEAERDAQLARAEANAKTTRITGVAEAEAVKARGLAEADAARAKAMAEADAIQARSAALAENQDAVIAQQLAENWPEIVAAAAKSFGNIDHMVVLNGADGVEDLFAKALSLGGTGLGLAKTLMQAMNGNGKVSLPE
ncbi:flotillin family protein [Kibdelosporangium lantanae]